MQIELYENLTYDLHADHNYHVKLKLQKHTA